MMRRQCSDLTNRNSTTTTLPLRLESRKVAPPGSTTEKSGDGRGRGAAGATSANPAIANTTTPAMNFCISHLLPLGRDSLHCRRGARGGVLWTTLALQNTLDHPGD